MFKINVKIAAIFLLGLCVGVLVISLIPYLQPKKTIFDRLRESQIYGVHRASLSEATLQHAKYLQRITDIEEFKRIYDEKDSSRGTYDAIYISVDVDWHVVWMELLLDNKPMNLEYLGFYIYSEVYAD